MGWDDDEFTRSDEPAMEGAGRHLQRASYEDDPKPPREPLILPDPTPEERTKIDAILAAGKRHVSDGWQRLQSREISLAKTKVEEAVMWAVKHLTA